MNVLNVTNLIINLLKDSEYTGQQHKINTPQRIWFYVNHGI